MRLTDDLFIENDGLMKIIPKGTIIKEADQTSYRPGDEDIPGSPDYVDPADNITDEDIERELESILSGDYLTGFFSPSEKKVYVADAQIYDGEHFENIEGAISWANTVGKELIDKNNIKDPVFGVSGPDESGNYYISLASASDLTNLESYDKAFSLHDAYKHYKETATKLAKEKAIENWEPDELGGRDPEDIIRDIEANKRRF